MHGLNKEFMADPPAFMQKYALDTVDPKLGCVNGKPLLDPGVYKFDLSLLKEDQGRVIVGLFSDRSNTGKHSHPIEAYWLPWKSGQTTELALGKGAQFFFTAKLSGCRIQIAGNKVLHIAGDRKNVVTVNNRTGKRYVTSADLVKEDPNQAMGVEWRDDQGRKHAGAAFDPARKFSSTTDYGTNGLGFLAGYATHGVWLFVGQTLQIDGAKLQVRSLTKLVGGDFAP